MIVHEEITRRTIVIAHLGGLTFGLTTIISLVPAVVNVMRLLTAVP